MKAVCRGDIFHRFFTTTKPPKHKFFVVVGEDDNNYVGYFFINSNVNRFVARSREMADMQMPIKPADYPFLDHVSFIDGHELSVLRKRVLIDELSAGTTRIKGRITDDDMERLLDAALQSPLFSERDKRFFR